MFHTNRAAVTQPHPTERLETGSERTGDWLFWLAGLGAFLWLAGAAALVSLALQSLDAPTLPLWSIIAAAAFSALPALLLLVSGAAAREGARARSQAQRLADAAERMLSPSPVAEAAARRLGTSVRGEIAALDRCVEQAISRFHHLDATVATQIASLGKAVDAAYDGSGDLSEHLAEQEQALTNIGRNLAAQAQAIGDAITKHQHALIEASRAAEVEMLAADEALESRLTSFAAAASLIGDRTEALETAAKASAEAALRLESTLSRSLEALSKVTGLTDAARVSAELAVEAAEQTARSLRSATHDAIEEARRVGDGLRRSPPSPAAAPNEISLGETLSGTSSARRRPLEEQPPRRESSAPASAPSRGLWRHMLAAIDDERSRTPDVREAPAPVPSFSPTGRTEVLDLGIAGRLLLERAGLRVEGLFSVAALEKIAQAGRRGTSARRRCVREQAPDAVLQFAQCLESDADLRRKTDALLSQEGPRLTDLLGRGRAPLSADATRIFLLLDAAQG